MNSKEFDKKFDKELDKRVEDRLLENKIEVYESKIKFITEKLDNMKAFSIFLKEANLSLENEESRVNETLRKNVTSKLEYLLLELYLELTELYDKIE